MWRDGVYDLGFNYSDGKNSAAITWVTNVTIDVDDCQDYTFSTQCASNKICINGTVTLIRRKNSSPTTRFKNLSCCIRQ